MSDEETKKREIKGLLNACKAFSLSKGLIVTYDSEEMFKSDGIEIELVPFFKWCCRGD